MKYSGSLDAVRALGASVTELLNEYAVVLIEESQIDRLSEIPEIEYIEKTKTIVFSGGSRTCSLLYLSVAVGKHRRQRQRSRGNGKEQFKRTGRIGGCIRQRNCV